MQAITLSDILHFFKDDVNTFTRGEEKYKAQRVLSFEINGETIKSSVQASMKDKAYVVTINLADGRLSSCICECPRGRWLCSHMAAALIYAEKSGISKTDLPSTWMKHPKKNQLKPANFENLFPEKKPDYRATNKPVTINIKEKFRLSLKENNIECGMEWLLRSEDAFSSTNSSSKTESLILEMESLILNDCANIRERLKLNIHQISDIEILTRGQSSNENWFRAKKFRITASNFGRVLRAIRIKSFPPSLFKTLCGAYNLKSKDCIIWGNIHEDVALSRYCDITGYHVRKCGIYLLNNGCVGGSPDGIVTDNCDLDDQGTLEIKCPYKYRFSTIVEAINMEKQQNTIKTFFLTEDFDLNREHDYYHQVQGCMYAANLLWCDFTVWTTKDIHIVRVLRDSNWANNILLIENFFFDIFLHHCKSQISS